MLHFHLRLALVQFVALLVCTRSLAETVEVQVFHTRFDADDSASTQVDTVTINAGDTIMWVRQAGTHTVTSGASSNPGDNPGDLFDAPINSVTTTFSFTFDTAGTYPYFCRIHEFLNMKGIILVNAPAVEADFGDAPDGEVAGFGPAVGRYPSLLNTVNSTLSGPYHVTTGLEILGAGVSVEPDARLTDADTSDDGFLGLAYLLGEEPVSGWARYRVTLDEAAPDEARHLNVNADLNRDGRWRADAVPEWIGQNVEVNVTPGTAGTVNAGPFAVPAGDAPAMPTWLRGTLTREPIADTFGADGWDGGGPAEGFEFGETEDFFFGGIGGGNIEVRLNTGTAEVQAKWLPRSVLVSPNGAWMCVPLCNPTEQDETALEISLTPAENRVTVTPNPLTVDLPARSCRWVCFHVAWSDGPVEHTDTATLSVNARLGDGVVSFEDAPGGSGGWAPWQLASPGGAVLTTEVDSGALQQSLPEWFLKEPESIPDPQSIGALGAGAPPIPPEKVFYAVDVDLGSGELRTPALLELPLGERTAGASGMAAGFGVPVKYDPGAQEWSPITESLVEPTDGTLSIELKASALYGIAGAADGDGDGLPDAWETAHGLDPTDGSDGTIDSDDDGLANPDEFAHGTAPNDTDSDGDGFWDNIEVEHESDPSSSESVPHDTGVDRDVNLDASVDALDVQLVVNGVLGIDTPFPTDVNNDQSTDALDVQSVVNAVLGVS